MSGNIHPARIEGDTLYLDINSAIDDPVLRSMARCVRELRPAVHRSIARHGHGTTLMALTAIIANEALVDGSEELIAKAFRDNAEMLEAHASVGAAAGHA